MLLDAARWKYSAFRMPKKLSIAALSKQLSWFNHHHLLEPSGYVPPSKAEANYYRQLASQVTAVVA